MIGKGERMCVVIVDDEPEIRELLGHILADEGYQVLCFEHPVPVIQLHETNEPLDLFLIDIMLPEMSGIELAKHLQEQGFAATPKIAISASELCVHQARASGLFDAVLPKPFDIVDVLTAVEQYASTA
jgi:CheY-like chemotaxis protein